MLRLLMNIFRLASCLSTVELTEKLKGELTRFKSIFRQLCGIINDFQRPGL